MDRRIQTEPYNKFDVGSSTAESGTRNLSEVSQIFSTFLGAFEDCEPLRRRVLIVLEKLPHAVQRDFLEDPRFAVTLENFVPGTGWTLWMASPGAFGSGSRCVVLRPKLAQCSEAFACYVIAHEFAHAFLRNGGWGAITDREEAADALAASWGFSRPAGDTTFQAPITQVKDLR
jgi:hypothetical protein